VRGERARRALARRRGERMVLVCRHRLLLDARGAVLAVVADPRAVGVSPALHAPASRAPRAARNVARTRSRPPLIPNRRHISRERIDLPPRWPVAHHWRPPWGSPAAPPSSCARSGTRGAQGCSSWSRPRGRSPCFARIDRLGQLGGGIAIAAIRHGDRVGLIDELGSLTFTELDERSNALACALRARGGRRGKLHRDPRPQPPRVPGHHVRGLEGRRAAPVPEHRLRRPAAEGRVRARGRDAARPRRGVRRADGRDRSASGPRARVDRAGRAADVGGDDPRVRGADAAAPDRALPVGAADERHHRHPEGSAAPGGALAASARGACYRRCRTASGSRATSRRRCSTGSGSRRWHWR